MAVMTIRQAVQYAHNAGFSGPDLVTIVSIGIVESGLDSDPRTGPGPASGHYGWLQISTDHGYTPDQLADPQTSANAAFKLYKARGGTGSGGAAGRFNDWVPYEKVSWKMYAPQVQSAVVAAALGNVQGGDVLGGLTTGAADQIDPEGATGGDKCTFKVHGGIGGSVPIIGSFLSTATGVPATTLAALGYIACYAEKISAWVLDTQNWYRVAEVLLGGVLVINGMNVLSKGTIPTVQKIAAKGAKGAIALA